jgi:hypothetical protein
MVKGGAYADRPASNIELASGVQSFRTPRRQTNRPLPPRACSAAGTSPAANALRVADARELTSMKNTSTTQRRGLTAKPT